jgi:hypothetical protein
MGDLGAYTFIALAALINFILLLKSKEYNKCDKNQGFGIYLVILFSLYLHYFINAFGLYGFLFDNKYILLIYLCVPVIIGLGWRLNKTDYFKSACTLTNATDLMCNVDKGDTIYFVELFRCLGVQDVDIGYTKTSPVFLAITAVGYIIAGWKLFNMMRKK